MPPVPPELLTIGLGVIANFTYNFMQGHKIAGRAYEALRSKLFGEAKTASEVKDEMWARLCKHTDLIQKVKLYQEAGNRLYSLRELGETFRKALGQQDAPSLEKRANEVLTFLWEEKELYDEILHELQLDILWELLKRIPPDRLRKRQEEVIRDYGEKLRTRCQIPDLAGVRGGRGAGVEVEDIYVNLYFLPREPPGGIPRIHPGDAPDDRRMMEYLERYGGKTPVEVDRLFANPPDEPILILGLPGAGKTTLAKYQSLQYVQSFEKQLDSGMPKYLPVFIRLRDFAESKDYLLDRLSWYLTSRTGEPMDSHILKFHLSLGQAAIFYDGLDEVADIAQRNRMAEDIDVFAKDYPEAFHVVTCRIAGYQEITSDMSSFAKYTIDDMKEEQQNTFIEKWYSARRDFFRERNMDDLVKNLQGKIKASSRLQHLAANPLMLTIMAFIYGERENIPDTRLELYTECVEVLLHRRDEATGQITVHELQGMMPTPKYVLGELAYGFHRDWEAQGSGIAELPRAEVQNRIVDIIIRGRKPEDDYERSAIKEEVPRFCTIIETRTSILADRGMGPYGFIHQTFQEYFAAYYLVGRPHGRSR
jgi:hypothetical protein